MNDKKSHFQINEKDTASPYAIWSITYDANGGTNAPAKQTANVGQSITITRNEPTRSGYTFLGWNSWSGATEPDPAYTPGNVYKSDYNMTLYAVWKQQMCTIVYDLQGGSGNFPDMNTYYGNSFKLRSEIPTKNGYVFKGWATSPAGNPVYQPSDIYKALGNATLYAVWEKVKKTFTITYDKNTTDTVTGMPTTQTKTEGIGISLSENIPVRDEYIFVHWSESSSDSGTSYNPGDLYTKDGNVTLYAIWKQEHKNMYIGSSSISSIYIGRDKVAAMYIGTTKVW